jgi:CDP-glucose 4,6-dehydratase
MGIWKSAMESLVMNQSFWKDKQVVLTGHTGFKGSWLALWLQSMRAHVHGYALAPSTLPNLFTLANVLDGMASHTIADIRDTQKIHDLFNKVKPEIVFHMAAQPLVRSSYAEPVETYAVNVMGTVNLLEAVRHSPSVKAVVNITTDKCYENKEWAWGYRENEPMGGHDPYSNSKGCAELVTSAYRQSYFSSSNSVNKVASARAGNVIGGGDWSKDRLIPDITKALNANKDIVIRNPKAVRPWQHVIEPLFGYLELGLKLNFDPIKYAEAYNFGPNINDALSVEEMAVKSIKCWGSGIFNVEVSNHNPHEAGLLKLDITKATNELNWKPVLDAQTAVERTINWYKNFYNNKSALELMESDIKYYQSKINE